MPKINVLIDNNKHYSITSNGNVISSLSYKHWYSANASIAVKDDDYTIVRKGFWGSEHEVLRGDDVVFLLKAQWDGGVAIIKPGDKEHFYEFKPKGFFVNGYSLTNYKGEELLFMTTNFSWKKFISGYDISCSDNFGNSPLERLLIAILVYHYNIAQTMALSAAAN